jgi:hypothetical protein
LEKGAGYTIGYSGFVTKELTDSANRSRQRKCTSAHNSLAEVEDGGSHGRTALLQSCDNESNFRGLKHVVHDITRITHPRDEQ